MKKTSHCISVFYCSNALQKEAFDYLNNNFKDITIKGISLPCSGKVNLLYLLKAIETDSDGVLLASCRLGECKYLQGNYRAQKRVDYVNELLAETGYERGRIRFVSFEKEDTISVLSGAIKSLAESFEHEIKEV
jgi:coenzyme F420-reducing hydrogenase delta subunit